MEDSREYRELPPLPPNRVQGGIQEYDSNYDISDPDEDGDLGADLAEMELLLSVTSKAAGQEAILEANPKAISALCEMGLVGSSAYIILGFSPKECVEACLRRSDHLLTEFKSLDDAVDSKYAEEVKTLSTKRNKLPQLDENGRFEDKGFNPSKENISLAHEILRGAVNEFKEISRADPKSGSVHGYAIKNLDKIIDDSKSDAYREMLGADFRLEGVSGTQDIQGAGNKPIPVGSSAGCGASEGGPGPGEEGGPAGNDVGIG